MQEEEPLHAFVTSARGAPRAQGKIPRKADSEQRQLNYRRLSLVNHGSPVKVLFDDRCEGCDQAA